MPFLCRYSREQSINIQPDENIIDAIVKSNLASSKSEAKRLILQGGVKVNGSKVLSFVNFVLKNDDIIQVGKEKFAKIFIY